MGTRSTIHFEEDGKNIGSVYGQMDGYVSNLGRRIKEIAGGATVVNGISSKMQAPEYFNRMGCAAAYIISQLKLNRYGDGEDTARVIGNIYMTSQGDRQEYNYFLYVESRTLYVRITDGDDKTIYEGPLNELDPKMEG